MTDAIERRTVLCGLALAPTIALPAVAPAIAGATLEGVNDMNMHTKISRAEPLEQLMAASRAEADAKFWAAHRHLTEIISTWEADPDNSEANWNAHAERHHTAFEAVMGTGVFTAKALLAKYLLTGGERIYLSGPAGNTLTMIQWDLERLAKGEMFGDSR